MMDELRYEKYRRLMGEVSWHHAFCREVFIISPSYYLPKDGVTIAPDSKPDIYVLVATGDGCCRYMEFILREPTVLALDFTGDIEPDIKLLNGNPMIRFSRTCKYCLCEGGLEVNRIEEVSDVYEPRYGLFNPFTRSGFRGEGSV